MKYTLRIATAAVLTLGQAHGLVEVATSNGGNQWAVNADFLWWKAVEDSLPVAIITDTTDTDLGTAQSADILNLNHKWDPGFRIGVGYTPCGCDWNLVAEWTHFNTKASRSFDPGTEDETIIPQWGSLTPFGAELATLSSNWHLQLNWADFLFNKTFCVDPCFELGIHAGLRAVWLHQKFNFSLVNAADTPVTNNLNSKSDYNSLGIVAGLDASWLVGCGISVNASAGGSLLYGRQKSSVSESLITGVGTNTIAGSSNYYISRAMTDVSLGLGWHGNITSCLEAALEIDWEHHILFCQNQFPRGSSTSNSRPRDGDLTIQGLTVSGTIFF